MTQMIRFQAFSYHNRDKADVASGKIREANLAIAGLRWFIAVVFFLLAVPAWGEVLIGPSLVHSSNLGYDENYLGARAEAGMRSDRFSMRLDLAAYDSKKVETDDGFGLRASLLGGIRINDHVTVLVGASYRRQSTSAWAKDGIAPRVEIEFSGKPGLLRLGAERMDEPDDQQTTISAEARIGKRFQPFVRGEWIEYETLFAKGNGSRYEAGVLFRVFGR